MFAGDRFVEVFGFDRRFEILSQLLGVGLVRHVGAGGELVCGGGDFTAEDVSSQHDDPLEAQIARRRDDRRQVRNVARQHPLEPLRVVGIVFTVVRPQSVRLAERARAPLARLVPVAALVVPSRVQSLFPESAESDLVDSLAEVRAAPPDDGVDKPPRTGALFREGHPAARRAVRERTLLGRVAEFTFEGLLSQRLDFRAQTATCARARDQEKRERRPHRAGDSASQRVNILANHAFCAAVTPARTPARELTTGLAPW
mmetsp:Transcript_17561/g.53470  ORF Transcript_17561/g.53470 Transcript_17561/m.53470 type:complete len:258 (-) Transcript_17561:158-931(-)